MCSSTKAAASDSNYVALRELHVMEVADLAERDLRTLSSGARRRVAIAAMLPSNTPLLLLDEPDNALDLVHEVSADLASKALSRIEKDGKHG